MDQQLSERLATNLRRLRHARGATQAELSTLAGVPRATWTHLESGQGNPTLDVVFRVSQALQVTLEELLRPPAAAARHYPARSLPTRRRGQSTERRLLPDPLPGNGFSRLELGRGAQVTGRRHPAGSHEYLTCESGELTLTAEGESFTLRPGDVLVFRGDLSHSYKSTARGASVAYSLVVRGPFAAGADGT